MSSPAPTCPPPRVRSRWQTSQPQPATESADGRPLLRDTRALARFELFLFTAVTTVLVVRGALAATGYPQVGGSSGLHVAHVLYGGLLMGVAIVMIQVLPGGRARVRAAFIGGIGFGLFIDEVGKFLTKDVNYFYKPTVTVIYAVFVLFYLGVRELIQHRPLDDRRRLAMAASAVSDLALGQLDEPARARALNLLEKAEPQVMADALRTALHADQCSLPRFEAWLTRRRDRAADRAGAALRSHLLGKGIAALLGLQLLGSAIELALILIQPSLGRTHGSHVTDAGSIAGTTASLVYVGFGLLRLRRGNEQGALRVLTRSAYVTLLFTQLFVFARYEWSGLIGFVFNLLLLSVLKLALHVFTEADDLTFDAAGTLVKTERPSEMRTSAPGGYGRPT